MHDQKIIPNNTDGAIATKFILITNMLHILIGNEAHAQIHVEGNPIMRCICRP